MGKITDSAWGAVSGKKQEISSKYDALDSDGKFKVQQAIALCIFAVLLLFYVVGFCIQLFASGTSSMSPLVCYKALLVFGGWKAMLAIVGFAILAVAVVFLYQRLSYNPLEDSRGVKRSGGATYGTAQFADDKEIKEALVLEDKRKAKEIVLGGHPKTGKAMSLPRKSGKNLNILVFGPPGSGKSFGFIRSHLLNTLVSGESHVTTDPKGELFEDTAPLYKKAGYRVRVFNLEHPEHSDSWNPLAGLDRDSLEDVNMICQIIVQGTAGDTSGGFFDDNVLNLLKALVLYVVCDKARADTEKNLPAVYDFLGTHNIQELDSVFEKLRASDPTHPALLPYHFFASGSDNIKASAVNGLGTRLSVLQEPAVRSLLSSNDIDLTALSSERCAYYVVIPAQANTYKFLSTLFFSFLFVLVPRAASARHMDRKCHPALNLILDEFCNLGVLGMASDGSSFTQTLSTVRSYDIRVAMAIQSLGQLQNRYQRGLWEEIVGDCDCMVMLGCNDDTTAEFWSKMSGTMTIEVSTAAETRSKLDPIQYQSQYKASVGEGKRMTLNTDELKALDQTLGIKNSALIYIAGHHIIQAVKFPFTNLDISRAKVDDADKIRIPDYTPIRFRPEDRQYEEDAIAKWKAGLTADKTEEPPKSEPEKKAPKKAKGARKPDKRADPKAKSQSPDKRRPGNPAATPKETGTGRVTGNGAPKGLAAKPKTPKKKKPDDAPKQPMTAEPERIDDPVLPEVVNPTPQGEAEPDITNFDVDPNTGEVLNDDVGSDAPDASERARDEEPDQDQGVGEKEPPEAAGGSPEPAKAAGSKSDPKKDGTGNNGNSGKPGKPGDADKSSGGSKNRSNNAKSGAANAAPTAGDDALMRLMTKQKPRPNTVKKNPAQAAKPKRASGQKAAPQKSDAKPSTVPAPQKPETKEPETKSGFVPDGDLGEDF